ncbi:DMT family transporter [Geopsychrobacter electrodiphilus]|uniref:DMT family transporter n=1 Tax=Geopsychrobacter electrodiphilus TaxID=225196 RepID=UPI0003A31026|nr:DMT family transporter [Geopsychrobacter electrodiphilus]
MQSLGYLAALGAASVWAFSSFLNVGPVRQLGAISFNAFRMLCVALILSLSLILTGQWDLPTHDLTISLVLSGFVGIYMGDTFLYSSVKRLGPRLAGLLFAANAPISFLIGICWFDESFQFINFFGVALVTSGVMLALAFRRNAGKHHWEQSVGRVGFGIAAGVLAAVCQSIGTFIALDAMQAGTNPVLATAIRVWISFSCLFLTLLLTRGTTIFSAYRTMNLAVAAQIMASGLLGMGVGMSLLLWAIKVAPVGIVATLSSTTPVLVLPAFWLLTKERPHIASAWAALAVVIGVSMVFTTG